MLDAVLAHGKDYVRLIVCDGQGCHGLLRNAIWGKFGSSLPPEDHGHILVFPFAP